MKVQVIERKNGTAVVYKGNSVLFANKAKAVAVARQLERAQ